MIYIITCGHLSISISICCVIGTHIVCVGAHLLCAMGPKSAMKAAPKKVVKAPAKAKASAKGKISKTKLIAKGTAAGHAQSES